MLSIRRSNLDDIDVIMCIYANARKFMKENNNPSQWGDTKPDRATVEGDINSGISYVIEDGSDVLGTFVFFVGNDPTYDVIYDGSWTNDEPYCVIHRVASSGKRGGIVKACTDYAAGFCRNVRIDTHRDNHVMQQALKRQGFVECGIIHLEDGDERIAFSLKRQVFNPYLPSYEYIPDGEPRVFGDRLYIYGSHDKFGGTVYCENDYVCWSAPVDNLTAWRYEGTIFKKTDHPDYDVNSRAQLYAPDVVKGLDGRYYLYYSLSESSIISVAVCDEPAGHYTYLGDMKRAGEELGLGALPGEYCQFDPSVLVDDDGRIYLYSGFSPMKTSEDSKGRKYVGCHAYELADDMMTVVSGPVIVIPRDALREEGAAYFEAPSMRKINGTYYLVYSAKVTGLYYYYSDNPMGGFKFGGRIHSTSDIGINGHDVTYPAYPVGNIHGGIVCVEGRYYIFDHRHTNHSSYQRQGVAEPITIDSQGKICQVESTSCGLNGGPLVGAGRYPAYILCNIIQNDGLAYITQDLPDVDPSSGDIDEFKMPVQYLHGMSNNVTIGYKYFEVNGEITSIVFTLRGYAEGSLSIRLSETGEAVGEMKISLNSDVWTDITLPCNIGKGIHPLFFGYEGSGEFDILRFELIRRGRFC